MAKTNGLNHLGLSVENLDETVAFFINVLGWQEAGRDENYPRSSISDGKLRLTLWQVDKSENVIAFDRRQNVGLHHLAIAVDSEGELNEFAQRVKAYQGATIEFMPELLGEGPRKHMMFNEPGGIRLELIWSGE